MLLRNLGKIIIAVLALGFIAALTWNQYRYIEQCTSTINGTRIC